MWIIEANYGWIIISGTSLQIGAIRRKDLLTLAPPIYSLSLSENHSMALSPDRIEAVGRAVLAWRVQEVRSFPVLRRDPLIVSGCSILLVGELPYLSSLRSPSDLDLSL